MELTAFVVPDEDGVVGLRLDRVTKRFGAREVLRGVSADLVRSPVALLGANGAGKSTLLRVLASLERPDGGALTLTRGRDPLLEVSPRVWGHAGREHRRHVGLAPQEASFPPGATCTDVLQYVAWLRCVPRARAQKRVGAALDRVGLTDRAGSRVSRLSGGMRQRLNLAQALLDEPALLLLDEPTAGLDLQQRAALLDIVRELSTSSLVVYSTHLVDDVVSLARTVAVLHEGQLRFVGALAEFTGEVDRAAVTAGAVEAAFLRLITSRAEGGAADPGS